MKTEEVRIKNGTLTLPRRIQSSMNFQDGEAIIVELNEDGTVTIRKKDTIVNLKGIIKKGETLELYNNTGYQFETSSKRQEKQ